MRAKPSRIVAMFKTCMLMAAFLAVTLRLPAQGAANSWQQFVWLRLQRFHDTVQVSYSLNNQKWSMIRLAYFPPDVPVEIGMVAAAPGKAGFEVTFDHFSLEPLSAPPKED